MLLWSAETQRSLYVKHGSVVLRVSGTGFLRKRKKDCDVHMKGEWRETSKCVIRMVKCGEHRHCGSDEASEAGGGHVIKSNSEMPETVLSYRPHG